MSENEVKIYYKEFKNNYIGPENVILSMFYFNRLNEAKEAMSKILVTHKKGEEFKFRDKDFFVGLKNYVQYDTINRNNSNFEIQDIQRMLEMELNSITLPMKFGDYYVLGLKKKEIGVEIKPFREVKEKIKHKIKEEKLRNEKKARLDLLKDKYKVEINLINELDY